jgi:hypothetical protein
VSPALQNPRSGSKINKLEAYPVGLNAKYTEELQWNIAGERPQDFNTAGSDEGRQERRVGLEKSQLRLQI